MSQIGSIKRLGLVAAVAALAATSLAIVSATSAPAASKLSGEIRFLSNDIYVVPDRALIARFEKKYPGVKVNLQSVANGAAGINLVLQPQLQAGAGPDVSIAFSGTGINPSAPKLYAAGNTVSLKGPWSKGMPKVIKQVSTTKGKAFIMIHSSPVSSVHYDTAAFSRLKLKVPRTWSQFLALCRTIRQKEPNTVPVATGGSQVPFNFVNASMMAGSTVYAKDPKWDGKRQRNQTTFAGTAGWRKTLQRFADMKTAGCLSPGVAADTSAAATSMIATGKAVMMPAVSLFTANIKAANPNGKYSSFPVPGDSAKDTRLMVYVSQGLVVNAKSKNLAAARAFVNYAATRNEAAAWAKANGQIPVQQFGTKNPVLPKEFGPLRGLIKSGKTVLSPFAFWPTASTTTELGKGVQTIYTGQNSVSDVLAKLDSTWAK